MKAELRGVLALCGVLAASCGQGGPTPYKLTAPSHFPVLALNADNPMTVEGVELGRRLYYEPRLSNDGRSCGGCHTQSNGFTSPRSGRPVLPHENLGWSTNFLWDGRKHCTLEEMMRFEVEEFFQADMGKLAAIPEYPGLFQRAFGTPEVSTARAAGAMAQFLRTLVSATSKFDKYLLGQTSLSETEQLGYMLFTTEKGDCFHCHAPPLMTDNTFHNNGLDADPTGPNAGRAAITGNAYDAGKWKTPSLRNVALRSTYMHDGRFTTLAQVIDHYDHGVHRTPSVDPIMTKPGKELGLRLSESEKAALVAFLGTLTDEAFITNAALANPTK